MKILSSFLKKFVLLIIVVAIGYSVIEYYSYIFAKTVIGRIDNVRRVTGVTAMFGGSRSLTEGQLHMFSVSIQQPNGEMITATSEDGQWAIAKAGQCVKARYYPHPPWNLKQAGTYFNARMLSLAKCTSPAAKEMGIDVKAYADQPISSDDKEPDEINQEEEAGGFVHDQPVSETPIPTSVMERPSGTL